MSLRLTLRTLLAYLDDTLSPHDSRSVGQKVSENPNAEELIQRIRKVTRRRGLATPPSGPAGGPTDPNVVAAYLSDVLPPDKVADFEQACLDSDVQLAEVAACHQILTIVLSEPVRVPPTARVRMYQLVKGREAIPDRKVTTSIPVGGLTDEEILRSESEDADAQLLLGMTPYEKADRGKRGIFSAVLVLGLAVLAGFTAWSALPSATTRPEVGKQYAYAAKTKEIEKQPEEEKEKQPKPPTGPKLEEAPLPREVALAKVPEKEPEPEMKPKPVPEGPKFFPRRSPQVRPVASYERSVPTPILLANVNNNWRRIHDDQPVVTSGQKLLALPGYRANISLPSADQSDLRVELWGNLPDLYPDSDMLGSTVTVYAPPQGYLGDLEIHAGRVYIGSKKPEGGNVFVRFGLTTWELQFPDDKSEVVLEAAPRLTGPIGSMSSAVNVTLAPISGKVNLRTRMNQYDELKPGQLLNWDSQERQMRGPDRPDGKATDRAPAYFSRFPLPPDAEAAKRILAALDELSQRLSADPRVAVILAEKVQQSGRLNLAAITAVRLGVFCQTAIGSLDDVVDSLNDADRPFARQAAVVGLQQKLAEEPALIEPLMELLEEKVRLSNREAEFVIKLFQGYGPTEMKQPDVIDRVIDGLASASIVIRELAFMNLVTQIDPEARSNQALMNFNAGAPEDFRSAAVRAWRARGETLKKQNQQNDKP